MTTTGGYITGYTDGSGRGLDYIAGQSPFDDASVLDIWRLIHQNCVTSVVVMSRVIEEGTLKCTQYWPDIGKAEYGPFKVTVIDQFTYAHFTERLLSVKLRRRRNTNVLLVRIFCFTGWPDRGIPQDPVPLLEMRNRVRKTHGTDPNPILVHCETGQAGPPSLSL
ncbi:hypothetical protein BaRGS_00037450 [Batillaria attramentaria]|uniref:Tyrosine-protein phosphatase domain-containing protein n=1 Tax=Batillaria attramentaria TaxID=370345 RepID=A0ABD0J9G9_9CAEN